jgi:hypothetical protein
MDADPQQKPDPARQWQGDERRSATPMTYTGEERRKADRQLDQMANGQSDG